MSTSPYAKAKDVKSIDDCYFYHTIDIPGHGTVRGEWDLRESPDAYLGNVDFKGKKVIEIGTASGFLCFHMESKGAEITSIDLSDKQCWDIVPYAQINIQELVDNRKNLIRMLNNGYWFAHKALNSKAKVVYTSLYDVPDMGKFDIATFSSVLLHVRDPFLALQRTLQYTTEKVIITEKPRSVNPISRLFSDKPLVPFLPEFKCKEPGPYETWWHLYPEIIKKFIGILGFEKVDINYHTQTYEKDGTKEKLYTIVGHRTRPIQDVKY